jgi:O-acetyl-ADP-ribose deacetylase (regulator of RNase III)
METRQIRNITIDILSVENPQFHSKQGDQLLAEALSAGAPASQGSARSTHQLTLGYRVALGCANERHLESIAFQGIDTLTCGCPLQDAARAAIGAVQEYINSHHQTSLRRILFVETSREAYDAFCEAVKDLPVPTE